MSDTTKPARRKLTFVTFDDVVRDAENLLAKGYTKTGNWDLAQVCFHLSEWLRYPVEGFPKVPLVMRPVFWAVRNTLAPRMLRKALAAGEAPTGQPTVPQSVGVPGSDAHEAVSKLKEAVERFKAFAGPFHPSPLFGVLDRDTGHRLQMLHCAHHLSFLVPTA